MKIFFDTRESRLPYLPPSLLLYLFVSLTVATGSARSEATGLTKLIYFRPVRPAAHCQRSLGQQQQQRVQLKEVRVAG